MLTRDEVLADWFKELDKVLEEWNKDLESKKKMRAGIEERVAILKEIDEVKHRELIKAYGGVIKDLTKEITYLTEVSIKHGEELKEDLTQKFESQ